MTEQQACTLCGAGGHTAAQCNWNQAEAPQGERVPDEAFEAEFMTWWEDEGQFCRAGGGNYERTFAFQAWRHLYPQLMQARAALAQPSSVPEAWIDVQAERRRQVEVEGWTHAHDDANYGDCSLAAAAATYALCDHPSQLKVCGADAWPWPDHWWKPTTYRRNLVKAGALILAEIERIDRAAIPAQGGE